MTELPTIGLYLPPSIARQVGTTITHLVYGEEPAAGDQLIVTTDGVIGVAKLAKTATPISKGVLEQHQAKHGIDRRLRKAWFPGGGQVWLKEVESFKAFAEPVEVELNGHGYGQMFHVKHVDAVEIVELSDKALRLLKSAQTLASEFDAMMPTLAEDVAGRADGATRALLSTLPAAADALASELGRFRVRSTRKAQPRDPEIVVSELHTTLMQLAGDVPDDATTLKGALLEGRDATGLLMTVMPALKRELPGLKVPDPIYLLDRFEDERDVGFLSGSERKARAGVEQVLLNELQMKEGTPEAYEKPQAWGVVRQGAAQLVDLADLEPEKVDPFTLAEFKERKEPRVFFMPLELVRRFEPPLELKRPVRGRRFAPTVDLDRDVMKQAELPDPVDLKQATPIELKRFGDRVNGIYVGHFKGNDKITDGGYNREDTVNAFVFILEEAERRGLAMTFDADLGREAKALMGKVEAGVEKQLPDGRGETAPIRPGTKATGLRPIALDEVVQHFEKSMKLRAPIVHLVGSVCNKGVTENDIDLLISGPLDDGLRRVIEFRLGRALPGELSQRASFLHDPDLGGPFTNHLPLYDLVLVPHGDVAAREVIEMSAVAKADDPLMDLPAKRGPRRVALQYHFRGKTLHGDLRMKLDDFLIGWTLLLQKPDLPQVKNVAEAKAAARTFDPEGSETNKDFVPPEGIQATPKKRQPVAWLHLEGDFIEPGEVGATRNLPGIIAPVTDAAKFVEWGVQEPFFHEYFLTGGKKMVGRLMFRLLTGSRQSETDLPFWRAILSKDHLPSILNRRSVNRKRMPPDGYSWIPTSLERVTPKEFRYWEQKGQKAREVRDALVDARFFTSDNVKIVNGQFARVEETKKTYLFVPDGMTQADVLKAPRSVPFVFSYQAWKGQTVVRAGPSREVWHLAFKVPGAGVVDFQLQGDPSVGERLTAVRKPMKGDELMTLEGDVEPGKSYSGDVLNDTKATPSHIEIKGKGTATLLEEADGVIRFQVQGGPLRGVHVLSAEEEAGDIWIYEKSEGPGQARKAAPTMRGDVQVWDPAKIPDDSDRSNDRLKFRPPAFIKPQKVAPRKTNQFNTIDEMIERFATEANLREGIVVEPKWNGFRLEGQSWGDATLIYTEDEWRDLSSTLPGLAKDLRELRGPVALDGEGMAVDEKGNPVARRDLARFHGKTPVDDSDFRFKVFNGLFLPRGGNALADGYLAQKKKLATYLRSVKSKRIELTPHKVAHTISDLKKAVAWAAKEPGSEGAMLKLADSTYSLGGENAGWAKLKVQRTITAIVQSRDPVEGSPGVWNYTMAVGPVSEPDRWKNVVEIGGKKYTVIGNTGNSKVNAKPGDTLAVNVLELLFERDAQGKKRLTWFGPPAVESEEPMKGSPFLTDRVIGMLERSELKKHTDQIISQARILKVAEPEDEEERIVFGEVLVPNVTGKEGPDSQGDTYDEKDVEEAAFWFMENGQRHSLMHEEFIEGKVRLLESYCAPVAMKLKDMDGKVREIPKKTWLMRLRIVDDDLWEKVQSGELTGFSIGGSGERTRVA